MRACGRNVIFFVVNSFRRSTNLNCQLVGGTFLAPSLDSPMSRNCRRKLLRRDHRPHHARVLLQGGAQVARRRWLALLHARRLLHIRPRPARGGSADHEGQGLVSAVGERARGPRFLLQPVTGTARRLERRRRETVRALVRRSLGPSRAPSLQPPRR